MIRKKSSDLAKKAKKYLAAKEAGKREYKRADELLEELIEKMKPGEEIALDGERKVRLVDNFDGKNTAYRAHGIKRFDIELVD